MNSGKHGLFTFHYQSESGGSLFGLPPTSYHSGNADKGYYYIEEKCEIVSTEDEHCVNLGSEAADFVTEKAKEKLKAVEKQEATNER